MAGELTLTILSRPDGERAQHAARDLAVELGFGREQVAEITLAVAELASNLVRYAERGQLTLAPVDGPRGRGLRVESADMGPGIADVSRAMQEGYSTGGGLGGGLPGVRRLMDDLDVTSSPAGTRIVASKWLAPRRAAG